ncbi:enoyl-CoA hydratase-related protein [Novosphingobium sp. HK4-1]|uniref:Enoyl-CoA hydratase-related protein n=1 Tax=Novosphingobium mangrovi (ex Huang et al. 2023) TaxID=2976432 RepID=A0ABT2I0I9_9SPHN|nr:enoyl-CoA hydratase-related protein [Novosphingobium mangrovi (ex Huang et al. 2023)]MCT2398314.1 enoyl-CoA hydratase-related protein [Novosphingobium mangrovi (ex Huang et al. 2023)]
MPESVAGPPPAFMQIRYEMAASAVARIVLARPEKRNAQGTRMTYEIDAAMRLVCDDEAVSVVVIAADDARFRDNTGSDMGVPGVEFFAHPFELGVRRAKQMLFTGGWLSAQVAAAAGMVNEVVPRAQLQERALELAREIARTDRFALKLMKASVNAAPVRAERTGPITTWRRIPGDCPTASRVSATTAGSMPTAISTSRTGARILSFRGDGTSIRPRSRPRCLPIPTWRRPSSSGCPTMTWARGSMRSCALEEAVKPDAGGLLDFVRGRLVAYKVPRSIEFIDSALRDEAGKARRDALRAERVAAAGDTA